MEPFPKFSLRRRLIATLLTLSFCALPSLGSTVTHLVIAIKDISLRGQTQPISQSNLFTTALPNSTYRLSWYMVVTSTTATAGTISGRLQYTDADLGAESVAFMNNVSASTIGPSSGSLIFKAVKGTSRSTQTSTATSTEHQRTTYT